MPAGIQFKIKALLQTPSFWLLLLFLSAALWAGLKVPPHWTVEHISRDIRKDDIGQLYYMQTGKREYVDEVVPYDESVLTPERVAELNRRGQSPAIQKQYVLKQTVQDGQVREDYYLLRVSPHWGPWSLLPAVVAVALCWLTREPLTSLLGGIVAGALLLCKYDITDSVLVESLAQPNAAGVLVLYLLLLGGLMGIWTRTGAAQAFAEYMTRRFVRGPRSAKLVAWFLGVIFFQGGTVSTVLVGTTVKPIADREKVSHEELAYIVDSTASPIASLLAFNAWPGYVQAFIFVAGVPWLLTEADRIRFFFMSIPFCFYAIFAVLFTFLLSINYSPFVGKKLQAAIIRARTTGQLDAPDAEPLSARELERTEVPTDYQPHVIDFFLPLGVLIFIAVYTFVTRGQPEVRWAFGSAVLSAAILAILRGLNLRKLMEGIGEGLKGVVVGSVILLLAITIGGISQQTGAGIYLVELLGERVPYWLLPLMLQALTIIIAFSTGTSWGTYAVAFPLAMPLAWAVAQGHGLAHPQFFMMICFAAVMDGSVYGDQCSPISDTTVLSAMCTGCDLMDHVRTQIPQASVASILAGIGWTASVLLFA